MSTYSPEARMPGFFINMFWGFLNPSGISQSDWEKFEKKWAAADSLSEEEIYQACLELAELGNWERQTSRLFLVEHVPGKQPVYVEVALWRDEPSQGSMYHFTVNDYDSGAFSYVWEAFEDCWKMALGKVAAVRAEIKRNKHLL